MDNHEFSSDDIHARVANLAARLEVLEEWQARQNGAICRVEEKVDKMIYLHYTELAVVLGALFAWLQSAIK